MAVVPGSVGGRHWSPAMCGEKSASGYGAPNTLQRGGLMNSVAFKASLRGAVAVLIVGASATPALAQVSSEGSRQSGADTNSASQDESSQAIGDIVVTAQKRSESIQRVPAAVTAVGSEDLQARGITDLRGLTVFVPSASLNPENVVTQIFIRGIGQQSDQETNDPAVATNVDGVYVPRYTLSGSLFDVERVEILPGPQGTLYGRNAAGGTVNVTTKTPGKEFAGEGSFEFGNYGLLHGFAAVDTPITDELSLRTAVDAIYHRGYITNGQDNQDSQSIRVTALYSSDSPLSVLVRGEYQHTGGNGASLILRPLPRPGNPWYQPKQAGEDYHVERRVYKASAELNYNFGGPSNVTLTYIPAYIRYSFDYRSPIGYPERYYPNPSTAARPLTGFNGALQNYGDTSNQVTNELRLSGDNDRLNWVLGLYAFHQYAFGPGVAFQIFNPASFTGGPTQPLAFTSGGNASYMNVVTDSKAAFGQATYKLTPELRITAGLRYSSDRRHAYGTAQSAVPISNIINPPLNYDLRLSDSRIDWRAGVEYDISPTSMAYANAATGYIGGGLNVSATLATAATFEPEEVMAYTIGLKNTFFDRSLKLNIEGFYYDYRDLQIAAFSSATGAAIQQNVPKSVNYGIQVDATYKPFPNTTIDGNIGYLHATVRKGMLPPQSVYTCGAGSTIPTVYCSGNNIIDYSGKTLPNAPRWSGALGIAQTVPMSSGAEFVARAGIRYQGKIWSSLTHQLGTDAPAYTKVDLSLTYVAPDRQWTIGAWVKNLTNAKAYTTPSFTSVYGLQTWFIDPPRTFGGRITFNF